MPDGLRPGYGPAITYRGRMGEPDFTYSNLSTRPRGRGLSVAGRFVPGITTVQADVVPYARSWEAANRVAMARIGPLWVVLGDSMAQGVGASRYDLGWPGQLAAQLDPSLRMVNLSVYGARVRDALDQQWPAVASLGETPALITVVIGSNDVVRRRYRADLPAAFSELLAALPPGAVIANLPNPHRAALAVDRLARAAVTARGLRLADMRTPQLRSWRGRLAADHFHPNDLGYAGMAAVVAGAVPVALRR